MEVCQPMRLIFRILGFYKKVLMEIKGDPTPTGDGYTYPVQPKEVHYYWLGIKIKTTIL